MSTNLQPQDIFERLFAKWKGKYIVRILLIVQLFSLLTAGFACGLYIELNAGLNSSQNAALLITLAILIVISLVILLVYAGQKTINTRKWLNPRKQMATDQDDIEARSLCWHEVSSFPRSNALVVFLTAIIGVTLILAVIMGIVAQCTTLQVIHIIIGGLIATAIVVIQNMMFLDRALAPVENSLLSNEIPIQINGFGLRLGSRLKVLIVTLVGVTLLIIGPMGYQKLIDLNATGTDQAAKSQEYLAQLVGIGIIGLTLSIGFGTLMANTVSKSLVGINEVIYAAENGDFSKRIPLQFSGEIASTSILLNRLFSELETIQNNTEKRASAYLAELTHKTNQLQSVSQIQNLAGTTVILKQVLDQTSQLLAVQYGFYHVRIYLSNDTNQILSVITDSDKNGLTSIPSQSTLKITPESIVGNSAYYRRTILVNDVSRETVHREDADTPLTKAEIAIPIIAQNNLLGVLDIRYDEVQIFKNDNVDFLEIVADQIGLAILNSLTREKRDDAIRQLESITQQNIRSGWASRLSKDRKGYHFTPAGISTIESDRMEILERGNNQANGIELPVTLRGQKIGTISLRRKEDIPWTQSEQALAQEIATQVALAIENARLLDDARQRAIQEQTINELTARFSRTLDADVLLQSAVRELHRIPNITEVSVFITPPESGIKEK